MPVGWLASSLFLSFDVDSAASSMRVIAGLHNQADLAGTQTSVVSSYKMVI